MMFFRKKKPKPKPTEERRSQYRRAPDKEHALNVRMMQGNKPPVACVLLDLSAGGAAVLVPKGRASRLSVGAQVRLSFSAVVHSSVVEAAVRLAHKTPAEGGTRYGFEFTEPQALFAQLDEFYIRYFNRRRALRARPERDRRIVVRLDSAADAVDAILLDVTVWGYGVLLSEESAPSLQGAAELLVSFVVPGSNVPIRWPAHPVHFTPIQRGIRAGGRFRPAEASQVLVERQALTEYVAERTSENARRGPAQ